MVIGVHSAKFPSEKLTQNIRQAVMRYGIEHPVVNDAGFKIWNSYAVRAWPTLVLINTEGRIAGEISGEILAEDLIEEIGDLIRQSPVAINRTPLDLLLEREREPVRLLSYPAKLLVSGDSLFVSDTGKHRILQIQLNEDRLGGTITRVFGSGESGLRDGLAEEASFNHPHGLGLRGDPHTGKLFVADTDNHAIRAVDLSTERVRTLAGTGQKAHGRQSRSGNPLEISLRSPWAVLPVEQYLFIAMAGSHQVWVMIGDDQIGPFAGNGAEALVDGPLSQSSFNQPSDLAFGMGYLFVADAEASAVRAISISQNAQTVTLVGQGLFDFGDQDGSTTTALLQHPTGLAVSERVVYVADTYNHKIKLLDPLSGNVHTLAGSGQPGLKDGSFEEAQFFEPQGVCEQGGLLFIADTNNHQVRVADLNSRSVLSFALRGLDEYPIPVGSQEDILSAVVVGSGMVRISLDVRLPDGYKFNPDAMTVVNINDGQAGSGRVLEFKPGQEIVWWMDLNFDKYLVFDLSVYYCQAEKSSLCLVHDRRLSIPLRIEKEGQTEIRIPYNISLPESIDNNTIQTG